MGVGEEIMCVVLVCVTKGGIHPGDGCVWEVLMFLHADVVCWCFV